MYIEFNFNLRLHDIIFFLYSETSCQVKSNYFFWNGMSTVKESIVHLKNLYGSKLQ